MPENEDVLSDVPRISPSSEELFGLLAKQDEVLSVLLDELETCKSELSVLRSVKKQQHNVDDVFRETETHPGDSSGNNRKLDKAVFVDEQDKSMTMKSILDELQKTRIEMKNLSQELEAKNTELSHTAEIITAKQAHIDRLNEILEKERTEKCNEFLQLNERFVEKTMECDRLITDNMAYKARLKVLEERNISKEKFVNDLTKSMAEERSKREEEEKMLGIRLTVLADENITLRNSLLTLTANSNEPSEEVKKLLEQQRNFIEILKSECDMLLNRLSKERTEHRKERKKLNRQIHVLNVRLERFISGKEELVEDA